jgi:tetratricopeptide (TPR) repeat protein
LFNPELIASALVREGITLNQQERPVEAITCFMRALETIKHLGYVKLEGYIYQALSEAQAKTQQSKESWYSIGLAEMAFEQQTVIPEQTLTRFNTSSLTAQKGVNAMLLHEYKNAVDQLDNSLANYDPTLVRGRARLLIQKAEAYYELGILDACTGNLQDAFSLARSIGSSKIMSRAKTLHRNLKQSKWRKERVVADLSDVLEE